MARPRGAFHRAPARRQTSWGLGTGGTAATTVSASAVGFLGSTYQITEVTMTLVRTRGIVSFNLKNADAVGDGFFGAVGIGLATDAAVTAGIASVPTPITEAHWDGWLWHQYMSVHVGMVADVSSAGTSMTVEIDSKAMRKLEAQMVVFCAFEVVEIGTGGLDMFHDSRVLLKD